MEDKINDVGTRVAAAILENSAIGQVVIEVEDQDGSIILKGNTATEQDKQVAEQVASSQEGVVEVINQLSCD